MPLSKDYCTTEELDLCLTAFAMTWTLYTFQIDALQSGLAAGDFSQSTMWKSSNTSSLCKVPYILSPRDPDPKDQR